MHKLIVANYKMNGNINFFRSLKSLNRLNLKGTNLVLCPPFVYVPFIKIKNKSLNLGVQNLSSEANSKSTGEISPEMLKEFNVKYAIIGHSERRAMGEDDETVAKRAVNALHNDITPIICVGEQNIEDGLTAVKSQVKAVYQAIKNNKINKEKEVIFAYEPVWAIGTGKQPSINDINKAIKLIKSASKSLTNVKVLYGGSINGNNYSDVNKSEADGFLLGGVSLKLNEFKQIVMGVDRCEREFC